MTTDPVTMARANLRLATVALGRLRRTSAAIRRLDPDEAEAAALRGLWYAARTWQPDKSAFSTWAWLLVRRELHRLVRSEQSWQRRSALVRQHAYAEAVADQRPRPKDVEHPMASRLAKAMRGLTAQQRQSLRRRFWLGWTLQRIGGVGGGASKQAGSDRVKKALRRLRTLMGVEG